MLEIPPISVVSEAALGANSLVGTVGLPEEEGRQKLQRVQSRTDPIPLSALPPANSASLISMAGRCHLFLSADRKVS